MIKKKKNKKKSEFKKQYEINVLKKKNLMKKLKMNNLKI